MGLTDLFRPKYKHSDAGVRAAAVQEMGAEEAHILAKIAQSDKDPQVRRIAIGKIDDAEILIDLVASESNASVRRDAQTRAAEIWSKGALSEELAESREALAKLALLEDQRFVADIVLKSPLPEIRTSALGRITDDRALAELVRKATDAALRVSALDRIDDPEVLRAIAMDEQRKQVGISAVDRIDDIAQLELIGSKAKNKHVRSRANKRAQELAKKPQVSDEEKRRHAERSQLYRQVKKLVNTSEWVESHSQVTAARRRWAEIGGEADELDEKWRKVCTKYFDRYETAGRRAIELAKQKAEQALLAEQEEAAAEERRALEETYRKAQEAEEDEVEDVAIDGVVSEEFQDEVSAATLNAEEHRREAREAAREEKQRVNLARLEVLCAELEELDVGDRYREIDRKLTSAAKVFSSLRPLPAGEEREKLAERYESARTALLIRSKEIREADEWKRWANLPKLEALIKSVEGMLEEEDSPELGKQLRAAQAEWKTIGAAPHGKSEELWQRFKTACDSLYERVREQRASAMEVYKENLAAKVALCEEVEALAESEEFEETAQKIKDLQAKWKEIGPVPRKKSNAIWNRFRAACDRFFERRQPLLDEANEERNENLAKKEAICGEIEALVESTEPWDEVKNKLMELKGTWRDIGHVPRKDFAGLSDRYKQACDKVFDKRRAEEREAREAETKALEALCTKLDAALADASVDDGWDTPDVADNSAIAQLTLELRSSALKMEDDNSAIRERVEALTRVALESHLDAFRGTDLDPDANRKRREKLCERLEELVPAAAAEPAEPTTPDEMAERLRNALAENALGGVFNEQGTRPLTEIVEEARRSWDRIGPVPGPAGLDLEERFESARQKVLDSVIDIEQL